LKDPTVTVCRILAEAYVGDDHQVGNQVFDGPHRTLHRAGGAVGLASLFVLGFGNPVEQHGADAQLNDRANLVHQAVDGKTVDVRHPGDRFGFPHAWHDDERIDQAIDGKTCLAYETAHVFAFSQPAHAVG